MAAKQAALPRAINSLNLLPLVRIMEPDGMDRGLPRVEQYNEGRGWCPYDLVIIQEEALKKNVL